MKREKKSDPVIIGGAGVSIVGSIACDTDVIVKCEVKGNINSSHQVTLKGASVVGNITAGNLTINDSKLQGNITVNALTVFENNAVVEGDIDTCTISIDSTVKFNGKCNTTNKDTPT